MTSTFAGGSPPASRRRHRSQALHPIAHADAIIWQCCASPGWGQAYAYALDTNVTDPGNDPAVISDGQILAAVQPLVTP